MIIIKHDMQHKAHAIYWWNVKVLCGIFLIAHFIVGMQLSVPTLIMDVPVCLGQMMAVVGGGLFVYHFVILKNINNAIGKPHTLLTNKGLFRWIRHPMYFADFIIYAGFMLLHLSLISAFLYIVVCVALAKQAKVEDKYLAKVFGQTHHQWSKKSWLLVPYIY
jgi:protein-S-isoprenylcysteine O-methyltransferase Ste14